MSAPQSPLESFGVDAEPDQAAMIAAGPDAERFARFHRNVHKSMRIAFWTGVALAAATVLLLAVLVATDDKAKFSDNICTAFGEFIAMAATLPALAAAYTLSIGGLFAPRGFYASPLAAKWLRMIGTRSGTAARVICLVAAILPMALVIVIWLVIQSKR